MSARGRGAPPPEVDKMLSTSGVSRFCVRCETFSSASQPIAVTAGFEYMAVVGQPVQNGTGKAGAAEDFNPLVERKICRNDQARSFISRRDDVEKEFTAQLTCRNIAEFVQDQKVERGQTFFQPLQRSFVTSFDHFGNQVGNAIESNLFPQLTGLDAKGCREVRFSRSWLTDQDDRFPIDNVFAAHQLRDQHLIERRLDLEVETFQRLDIREPRRFQTPFRGTILPFEKFPLRKLE